MTDAPDPGLTDLIAAALVRSSPNSIDTFDLLPYHRQEAWRVRSREVALAVEQHTNGRITALEAELEKQKRGGRTLGKTIDRTLKDVVAAVGAQDMIDEDGDGDYAAVFEKLFELRPARDAAIVRYMAAEYTLARVHEVYENLCPGDDMTFVAYSDLTAALEGEQQ